MVRNKKSELPNFPPQLDVYKEIFHKLPAAFGISQDGIVVDCNDAFAGLLNSKREDLIGNHITEYMCPTDKNTALERIQKRKQGLSVDSQIIYNMKRPDGSRFLVEAVILGIGPGLDAAFVQDVTRWTESANRLASVDMFRSELDAGNLQNLDRIASAAGKMMEAECAVYYRMNDGTMSVAGSWQMPKHLEDVEIDKYISYEAFRKGAKGCYIQRDVQSSGYAETDPLVMNTDCTFYVGQLVKDGSKPIGVLSLFFSAERNIYTTEHHFLQDMAGMLATEEELLRRTSELQAIFRAIPDLYFRVKSDGTILEHFTGDPRSLYLPKEQFTGKRMQDVLPVSAGEICWSAIHNAYETKSVVLVEYSLPLHGEETFFEARMAPFMDDQVIAVVRNITEQKQSQETVLESLAALERAYQLQSEFVRNMTHDVRTPLTSVIGYTEALLDGFAGTLTDEQRTMLKRIVGQANSLLATLEEILESAKLAAGVHKLDLKTIDLERIIGDALTLAEPAVMEKGIDLDTKIDKNLPMIVSDSQKILRILTNLITNAVKFTFDGGIRIHVNSSADGVDVVIADTGTGIPEERQDQIFDAFIQLSYPKKHKPAGTGLGLSIVAELVDILQCRLILSSSPGVGTAFTLHIPLKLEQTRSKRGRLPIS